MLLHNIRQILVQMREDPSIAGELPIVKRAIVRTFSWMLLTELFLVLQIFPVKYFMDEITKPSPSPRRIILIAISLVVLYKLGQELRRHMDTHRNEVFWGCWRVWWGYGNRCLLRQSTDWHTEHSTGEKESLVGKNVAKFQNLFDEALFNTVPVTLRIVFTTVLMFFIGWQYGVVAVVTSLVYSVVLLTGERAMTPMREDFQTRIKEVEDKGSELNQNWRTIRTLGMEEVFADENDHMLRRFWIDETPRHRKYLKYLLRQDDVVTLSRATLYLVAGLLVAKASSGSATVSFGSIVLATTWMERAYSNFGRFSDFQRYLNTGKEALKELVSFIQTPPTVVNADVPEWPRKMLGAVSFDKVTFIYSGIDPTICSLSLKVTEHTSIAFVGESGSGKSTLMRLLAREYDPQKGAIYVDGINLRDIDYARYRNQMIAVVSQAIELFNRSIADNIRIARPDATSAEVSEAARGAGAHDFIMATENGYDTMIGENGLRLSGGQRQRLAIARALIMKPAILIMDEATSALDAMSQAEVQATIDDLIARRVCTIFIIAHRLSTVRGADTIVVLDSGKIESIGTHAQLLERSAIYQRMVSLEL